MRCRLGKASSNTHTQHRSRLPRRRDSCDRSTTRISMSDWRNCLLIHSFKYENQHERLKSCLSTFIDFTDLDINIYFTASCSNPPKRKKKSQKKFSVQYNFVLRLFYFITKPLMDAVRNAMLEMHCLPSKNIQYPLSGSSKRRRQKKKNNFFDSLYLLFAPCDN